MSLHRRNQRRVGPLDTRAQGGGSESVRVSETITIAEGDAVAVVVARTALGNLPLIVPVHARNERPLPEPALRSKHPTIPAPAPAAMEPRNPAATSPPPQPSVPRRRRSQWRITLRPEAKNP